jgi:hypothetical protein
MPFSGLFLSFFNHSGIYSCPFNVLNHSYNHYFESFICDFKCFCISRVCYCEIVGFWRRYAALYFHISSFSVLAFVHVGPSQWLKLLITCCFSVALLSMFSQELNWQVVSYYWTVCVP